jgi:hypothetical protein
VKKAVTSVKKWPKLALFGYFFAWTIYFFLFWSRALYLDAQGNLMAGLVNIWGDWAAHLTMVNAIATRGIFIHSPFLLGAKLSYPFLINAISAGLLAVRVPLIPAMILPSFICSLFLVGVLFWFFKVIFQSSKIAIISSLIFFFNGGVGFYFFLRDALASGQPLQFLWNIPHEYTRLDIEHIKWISVIDSMVIPQRSFVLGFPLALLALGLLWKYLVAQKPTRQNWLPIALASVIIGLLPFAHTHSFLACFVILASWSLASVLPGKWPPRRKQFFAWGGVVAVVCVVAVPLLQLFFTGHVDQKFLQWYPGWLATEFKMNWLVFWLKNWLITPVLSAVGAVVYLWQHKKLKLQRLSFVLPFFTIFVLANIFLFQPFSWDNTKLIVWASVGFAGLTGYLLTQLWQRGNLNWKILAVVLFAITIASGTIDAYRVLRVPLHSYAMFSQTDLQLANWVRTSTNKNSIWLTGDQHNHWLFDLTGRQTVMAYRGWLWSQGYNYQPIEADVYEMFRGSSKSLGLLQRYGVNYVVIGENERRDFLANQAWFDQTFPITFELGTTKIYSVEPKESSTN